MDKIKVLQYNPSLEGMARIFNNVVFSTASGRDLLADIVVPWGVSIGKRFPLVVFIQGSAWTKPDNAYEIPQMCALARKGYVVAMLTHRNALEGNPFPAFLCDIKTGIRFLRKNADEYGIDPGRVGVFGTSSGGNTALLVSLTGDDERFVTDEHPGYSDAVKFAIDCFGPADIGEWLDSIEEMPLEWSRNIFRALRGEDTPENRERLEAMNPASYLRVGGIFPPCLLLYGDNDTLVPFENGLSFYLKMLEAGGHAEMIRVANAEHEGNFWSEDVWSEIERFISEHI